MKLNTRLQLNKETLKPLTQEHAVALNGGVFSGGPVRCFTRGSYLDNGKYGNLCIQD